MGLCVRALPDELRETLATSAGVQLGRGDRERTAAWRYVRGAFFGVSGGSAPTRSISSVRTDDGRARSTRERGAVRARSSSARRG
jgi:hypothetical protein